MRVPDIPLHVDIDGLLEKLTLNERISLLSAKDWWRTPVIDREGVFVPHIKASSTLLEKSERAENAAW